MRVSRTPRLCGMSLHRACWAVLVVALGCYDASDPGDASSQATSRSDPEGSTPGSDGGAETDGELFAGEGTVASCFGRSEEQCIMPMCRVYAAYWIDADGNRFKPGYVSCGESREPCLGDLPCARGPEGEFRIFPGSGVGCVPEGWVVIGEEIGEESSPDARMACDDLWAAVFNGGDEDGGTEP